MFHTASSDGYLYPSSRYISLGFPSESEIPGLDLRIKSIFFRPCHVLHGKYIIQDSRRVWFPSCNVSWEAWGEGCIGFEGAGGLVKDVKGYWRKIWDGDGKMGIPEIMGAAEMTMTERSLEGPSQMGNLGASLLASVDLSHLPPDTETLLLPHTHSSYNPFSVFFHPNTKAPSTPLNTFLLSRVSRAQSSITIYTPNLTYPPFINALFEALSRGINVRITVSKKLMILEQLITAGTVTEWEIWKMRRRYRKLRTRLRKTAGDLETGNTRVGNLDIIYFDPANVLVNEGNDANLRSEGPVHVTAGLESIGKESRPVKLHLKMTIIDGEITILGSGNMDRASWVTSQELGVAIFSEQVSRSLGGVAKTVYG